METKTTGRIVVEKTERGLLKSIYNGETGEKQLVISKNEDPWNIIKFQSVEGAIEVTDAMTENAVQYQMEDCVDDSRKVIEGELGYKFYKRSHVIGAIAGATIIGAGISAAIMMWRLRKKKK